MQASMAAAANKPIISDEEYDELKAKLRTKNSKVVQQVRDRATVSTARMHCVCEISLCVHFDIEEPWYAVLLIDDMQQGGAQCKISYHACTAPLVCQLVT